MWRFSLGTAVWWDEKLCNNQRILYYIVANLCSQIVFGFDLGLLSGVDLISQAAGKTFSIRQFFALRLAFDVIVVLHVFVVTHQDKERHGVKEGECHQGAGPPVK